MVDHEQPADGSGEGLTAHDPGGRIQPPSRRQGSMRMQNAATSAPRPPTAAEARQREKARKAREAAEELAEAEELDRLRRAERRRKVMMGSIAVVGVAGVIGMIYLSADRGADREVAATCVKEGTDEVVPEEYCSTGASRGAGIFIFAGLPYRYYYGGNNGGVGTIARGGTLELPKGTAGRTSSGSTITRGKGSGVSITRGGFGSGSHSSGGG